MGARKLKPRSGGSESANLCGFEGAEASGKSRSLKKEDARQIDCRSDGERKGGSRCNQAQLGFR